jgi:hypothetical protein
VHGESRIDYQNTVYTGAFYRYSSTGTPEFTDSRVHSTRLQHMF